MLTFADALSMCIGTFAFWYFEKIYKDPKTTAHKIWVENRETLAAGGVRTDQLENSIKSGPMQVHYRLD